jgi:hypothetical protein
MKTQIYLVVYHIMVVKWPKCRSVEGSNPTGGMDVCLLCSLCVVRYRSLRRANHSSRGVLPTGRVVVCDQEISCNEEALVRAGLQCQKEKNDNNNTIAITLTLQQMHLRRQQVYSQTLITVHGNKNRG